MTTSLPQKPERPLDSDCCGQGCNPCVLDLYDQELEIWETECTKILTGDNVTSDGEESTCSKFDGPVLSATEYRSFKVKSVTSATHHANVYRVHLPAGVSLGLQTGQHIVIRGTVDGEMVTRQYTPVSDVNTTSYFDVLIKIYENGRMSKYIKTLNAGDQIQVRGPFGSLSYKANKYKTIYMLAVGTGIAPMCQVIQTVLGNEEDETIIRLLYGCKTYQDILVKSYLDEWQGYWNFSCTYYLSQESQPSEGSAYRYGDVVQHGRIDSDVVNSLISEPADNILVLLCGTRSFEQDMLQCMNNLNIPQDKFHKF